MTREEFTGVTFKDLDSSGTRISRSSKFSVVNNTEMALNVPHKMHESGDYRQETLETRKVDNNKDTQDTFRKPTSMICNTLFGRVFRK